MATNAPYGIAKRIMHAHSISYRKQYEYNSILLILTNLFGPGDNFNPDTSHVVAALIKKFYDAKKNNEKSLVDLPLPQTITSLSFLYTFPNVYGIEAGLTSLVKLPFEGAILIF